MPAKIKYPDFGQRMIQAADVNPKVPPMNHNRLGWIVDQMQSRFGHSVTKETVRKWFAGETIPRAEASKYLAQIMEQSPEWLLLGVRTGVDTKTTKARNALASGAVNVVAGMIQMAGWHVAFAKKEDEAKYDFEVIIRGAKYQMHIASGRLVGGDWDFAIPTEAKDSFVIGLCPISPTCFTLIEIDQEHLEEVGSAKRGSYEITVHESFEGWRKIESFAERL